MTAAPSRSTGPCSAPASPWPSPESCSSGSGDSSVPNGSGGKSTSISSVEAPSQDRTDGAGWAASTYLPEGLNTPVEQDENRRTKEEAGTATSGDRVHATGRIEVKTYEPITYDQPAEGPALVRIHVVEDFSGDIEGE